MLSGANGALVMMHVTLGSMGNLENVILVILRDELLYPKHFQHEVKKIQKYGSEATEAEEDEFRVTTSTTGT